MKIYGIFDANEDKESLEVLLNRMTSHITNGSLLKSDAFVAPSFGACHVFSESLPHYGIPIWNENKTKCMIMIGKIFDYEEEKKELIKKGHTFLHQKSDAEYILHSIEEYGTNFIVDLNGFFVFVMFDISNNSILVVNDRCGMKPLYYFLDGCHFIFASEVKAIIKDEKLKKQINWDAWRDFFSYGYMLGNKTPFKNIFALPPATILSLTADGQISFKRYWNYAQIKIDYNNSEQYFINESVRLLKQAIERQTRDINDCIVMLSGGYDSRFIACAIKQYTNVNFETFTTRATNFLNSTLSLPARLFTYLDPIIAKEVAKSLLVRNTYVPIPDDLYSRYLIEKVFLLDGMTVEHLWMLPIVDKIDKGQINFDGIAGDILLRGGLISAEGLANVDDHEKLIYVLDRQMRRFLSVPTDIIISLFSNPVQEKIAPKMDSIINEVNDIGQHKNVITIFYINNRTRRSISLLPNNVIGKKTFCLFPFLDKDLLEFSLTIPPNLKVKNKIYRHILNVMFPKVMKIPATTFLSLAFVKYWGKKYIFTLPISLCRHLKFSNLPFYRQNAEILMSIFRKTTCEYINRVKVEELVHEYLSKGKDPLPFLVPIVEFCIWYDLFFCKGQNWPSDILSITEESNYEQVQSYCKKC